MLTQLLKGKKKKKKIKNICWIFCGCGVPSIALFVQTKQKGQNGTTHPYGITGSGFRL